MKPVWEMTRREADAEFWERMEASRAAGGSRPNDARQWSLSMALQTVAYLRGVARHWKLSSAGTHAELLRRIVSDAAIVAYCTRKMP